MKFNILVSAGVALLVVVLGLVFLGQPTTEKTTVERIIEKLGAIPGNDLPGPVVKLNGAPIVALSQKFQTGTTTVCSFDVRGYASSSIMALGATVNGLPTTTGTSWKWYWGQGSHSSTTIISGNRVTATGTSILATTSLAADTAIVSSGRNYIVLDFEGGSTPYFAMEGQTGSCSVLLHSPNTQ